MIEFIKQLTKQMKVAADSQQYERATEIRDTLQRLENLKTKQKMENVKHSDEEYFGIRKFENSAIVMTFRKIHGVIRDSDKFTFDLVGDNTFSNFLYQYYTTHSIPKKILVNEEPENKEFLESMLSKNARFNVRIISPKKGNAKNIIELIMKNISLILSNNADPALIELQEILRLKEIPKIIECFDVSNHGTDYAVGAMSKFIDGRPQRAGYRKFRIKRVKGRNDYAMISEIVYRRYSRLVGDNTQMPNLILIDGGKGHLRSAMKSLQILKVKTPCISLAKENEEVFIPKRKESVKISRDRSSLKILQYARDEAHRFGIRYNQNLRRLKNFYS